MSTTTKIPPEELFHFFDRFTKRFLRDESPEVVGAEVLAPDWGDQFALRGARLLGITYDPGASALEFASPSGDHRVYHPQEVWVVEEPDGFVSAVELVRDDGVHEVATVKRGRPETRRPM